MKENIDKIEKNFAERFPEIGQVNAPTFNKKYDVWVVRVKTNNSWKAVWRSGEEESRLVHERLMLLRQKQLASKPKEETPAAPKVVAVKKEEQTSNKDPKYSFNKKTDTKVENKMTSTTPAKKVPVTK